MNGLKHRFNQFHDEEEKKVMECTLEPRNLNVRMEPNPILPEIYLFDD
jgi:hypothetical protein